tara:strand:+ start:184 stop:531 length:348 start_codon:yes stop_codon:yes gene_type:complete
LISGLFASSINFLFFNSLFFFFKNIFIASVCGYCSGLLVSFICAKIWVFQDRSEEKFFQSFSIFCLIYVLGGLEMSFVIYFMDQIINNHKVAWLFGAFIGSLNNYFGSKYLLFRK